MRFEEILRAQTRRLKAMFGDSVTLSYPLPAIVNGRKADRVFLYRHAGAQLDAPRPFGLLTLDADTGEVLCFEDARVHDFLEDAGTAPDAVISYRLPEPVSVRDYQMEQTMLRKLYEGVRLAAFSETLTEEAHEVVDKYCFLLEHAVPTALRPYYAAMGRGFDEWRKEHA